MTVQECYAAMGADYNGVLERLMKEERIIKYLGKFVNVDNIGVITAALDAENYEEAFRNVHSLKGVSANLGLTKIFETSNVLCEALRGGKPSVDITGMLNDVKAAYADAEALIREVL